MNNIERSISTSDVLDLSKKSYQENNTDITLDLKEIFIEYLKDDTHLHDKKSLEKILQQISSDLKVEESISTILFAMKSSQSKSFANLNKPNFTHRSIIQEHVPDMKSTKQKPEIADDISKSDDFHLTLEMSRKLLDHQFVTRQKMINSQLEKALYDMPVKRSLQQANSEFIPTTTNQEFIALVGFSEIIDVLKNDQQSLTETKEDSDCQQAPIYLCSQCGTDASSVWKKRKIDQNTEEIVCVKCSEKISQEKNQKELEEQIKKIKSQFEEQEKNLIRDYNDMLSSPKKLEMFRQEQEKRHRVQRMGTLNVNKANRQSLNSAQNIKSNKPNFTLNNKQNTATSTSITTIPTKLPYRGPPIKEMNNTRPQPTVNATVNSTNGEPNQAQLTYLQFLQAFTQHVTNSQQNIDKENLQKLEQILAMVQSNPLLANNNMTVLQLIANLSNLQESSSNSNENNSVANAGNSSANTNLLNLLSYFVNSMQTQQNSNVI